MVSESKKTKANDLRRKFEMAKGIYLTEFKGLTVSEALKLRRMLWPLNVEYRVVKNTYLRYASQGTGSEALAPYFQGPTAALFCFKDPITPLQTLVGFIAGNPSVKIKAGFLEGSLLSPQDIERLSKLPSQRDLQRMCVFSLVSPLRGALRCFSWPLLSFLLVLTKIHEKRQTK